METYEIKITLTKQQMADIGHEYDLICRMEDVEWELKDQLENYEKEGDKDTLIINGKEIKRDEFLKKFDIRALAIDYEDRYEWDMNGKALMENIVSDAIDEVINEIE